MFVKVTLPTLPLSVVVMFQLLDPVVQVSVSEGPALPVTVLATVGLL